MKSIRKTFMVMAGLVFLAACSNNDNGPVVHNPDTAPSASIDRFSDSAGHLFVRSATSTLPMADVAVNFDQAPFIATGFGPEGKVIQYYNFDVQTTQPAPIYVLFKEGESTPVENQLNIIDVLPGDTGYNDFWIVNKVTVPADYVANHVASLDEINSAGYSIEPTAMLVNCPVVPAGSTANERLNGESADLHQGWYRGMKVFYFTFSEKSLEGSQVPLANVFVTFNTDGDPSSGFVTEPGSAQTHNVISALPANSSYSPLWLVHVYANSDFSMVRNLMTAEQADILNNAAAMVNCPVVSIQ